MQGPADSNHSQEKQQSIPSEQKPNVQDQPKARAPMTFVGGSRNPLSKPVINGTRSWSYGLFGCCGDPVKAVMAACLPCFLYAQSQSKTKALEVTQLPAPGGGDAATTDCLAFGAASLVGCHCIFVYMQRQELERRYKIKDAASGILVAWCCLWCALAQQAREIEAEEK
ncbi:hypothetical protein RQP46_005251 [Phenoliferia psychrophenolica]